METAPTCKMLSALKTEGVRPGHLYIVATPIGNLGDITFRALEVLGAVNCVAAEDTRNTARLLAHFQIQKPLVSLHEHNEAWRTQGLLAALQRGESIALVSDAGTPTLSDPGFILIREAIAAGIPLVPVPGASAALTLMSVSGLPTDRFLFCGFPPKKAGRRRRWIEELADMPVPLIFYVSPHGMEVFLRELREVLGNRPAVLGREMTKLYEEFLRGTLQDLETLLGERDRVRGECSLVVAGKEAGSGEPVSGSGDALDALIRKALLEGKEKPSILAKNLSGTLGIDRKSLYERILAIREED